METIEYRGWKIQVAHDKDNNIWGGTGRSPLSQSTAHTAAESKETVIDNLKGQIDGFMKAEEEK